MMDFLLKEQLHSLIKSNGLNVTKLSKLSGINAQTLHNWLSGQKPKNIIQVKQVADFFNVSIEHLCFGEKEKPGNQTDIQKYNEEINAGIFEVVLRRVKK